jgi:hypothetical protein
MLKRTICFMFSFLFVSFLFNPVLLSQTGNSFAEKVADAYGFKVFNKVKSLSFTFNVQKKNKLTLRSWYWEPVTNKVTYKGPGKDGKEINYSYVRGAIDKKDTVKLFVDAMFTNDQYWLLFPFHLVWDDKAEIEDSGARPYPLSKKMSHCLIVKYPPAAGGYTPGDIFELYVGKDNLIHEWVYRQGGKENGRTLTWEGYKNFNGLNLSTLHNVADKSFKLWFSGIKVLLN